MKLRFGLLLLLLGMGWMPLTAQTVTVAYQQRVEMRVPGATAAYSLNSFYADASVVDGVVVIQGNNPGSTTVMVVTGVGLQSFRITVPQPAPVYPPGFEPPRQGRNYEEGSYELRFDTDPSQLQNVVDLSSRQGDRVMRFHMANSDYPGGVSGSSPVVLPGLSYELDTPRRDVTLADQTVVNSPLTLDNVLVRGFHLREGAWFFHVGYTSQSVFQNLLVPTQKDTVVGLGYRFRLGEHSSLTPNLYYVDADTSLATTAHSGAIGSLVFRHEVGKRFKLLAETGYGRGLGVAGKLDFQRNAEERINGDFRYEPASFSSVSVNNLHGVLSTFRWDRKLNRKLNSAVDFSGNRYDLPQSIEQVNISSDWNLDYRLTKHWSATSGIVYSRFSGGIGSAAYLQNAQVPMGVNFTSFHWGAGFLYRESVVSNEGGSGQGFRGNATWSLQPWHLSVFYDRQTNVPTVSALVSAVPGLQDLLDRLGITATTPQQISALLLNDATLQALGLVSNLTLNLSPVLTQTGATLNWSSHSSAQQLFISFLNSSNQMLTSTQQSTVYSATYSRKLTPSNTVFVSYSLYCTRTPGASSSYQPLLEVSLRHKFNSVPPFLMPGRKGTISGIVFRDLQLEGVFHEGMPPMAGVEIVLDGARRATTDAAGHYSFSRVPYGPHRLQVAFHAERPFYFTTQSDVSAEIDTTVNFGIAFSRARLIGHVVNDAGIPVFGVKVGVSGAERIYSAQTDAGGTFTIADLEAGPFRAEISPESLPMGYVSEGLEPVDGELLVGAPKHITFKLKAIRAIAGKVSIFDSAQSREVTMPGVTVRVVETGAESISDPEGNYLFRNMPAGAFTLAVSYQGKDFKLSVDLPPTPSLSRGNNFGLGRR
jgi:hypothetical protein